MKNQQKNTHNTLQRTWTDKTVQRTNDTLTQRWFIDCSELKTKNMKSNKKKLRQKTCDSYINGFYTI